MKIKWQNLAEGQCPKCDLKLKRDAKLFVCPDETKCEFVISKTKIAEILLDRDSGVYQHMSADQRQMVEKVLSLG